jgi:hypothetical protein
MICDKCKYQEQVLFIVDGMLKCDTKYNIIIIEEYPE